MWMWTRMVRPYWGFSRSNPASNPGSEGKRHSWIQLGVNGAISRLGACEKSIRSRHRLCDTDFWIGHCRRSITRKELYGRSSFLHNISSLKSAKESLFIIIQSSYTPTISAAVQFWCIFNYDAWKAVISFRGVLSTSRTFRKYRVTYFLLNTTGSSTS